MYTQIWWIETGWHRSSCRSKRHQFCRLRCSPERRQNALPRIKSRESRYCQTSSYVSARIDRFDAFFFECERICLHEWSWIGWRSRLWFIHALPSLKRRRFKMLCRAFAEVLSHHYCISGKHTHTHRILWMIWPTHEQSSNNVQLLNMGQQYCRRYRSFRRSAEESPTGRRKEAEGGFENTFG